MLNRQLELTLESTRSRHSAGSNRRKVRARWWFDHMHQVVDNARDFSSPQPKRASGASGGCTR